MRRMTDFLSEDSNQFGPGTDLMISLLAVLLVMTLISSHLYSLERKKNDPNKGGNFKLASDFFSAGDFYPRPVTKLIKPQETDQRIKKIVQEYNQSKAEFPYVFVIGHSNQLDDPNANDKSYAGRLQRNWEYAGRRAAAIAALMQEHLTQKQKDNLVVITTGEFDLKVPSAPISQENAWVEVVFAKEWKPPARKAPN
jgi:NADH dehydrogenase FAD-containing subunit